MSRELSESVVCPERLLKELVPGLKLLAIPGPSTRLRVESRELTMLGIREVEIQPAEIRPSHSEMTSISIRATG